MSPTIRGHTTRYENPILVFRFFVGPHNNFTQSGLQRTSRFVPTHPRVGFRGVRVPVALHALGRPLSGPMNPKMS